MRDVPKRQDEDSAVIKAVVFDVGGVLKYWNNETYFTKMSELLGVQKKSYIEAYLSVKVGWERGKLATDEALAAIGKKLGVSPEKVRKADQTVWGSFPVFYDTVEIAKQLKKTGYTIVALTDTNPMRYKLVREKGVLDGFDIVITSFDTGYMKPEKKAYENVLDKLDMDAEEVVFIDDSPGNVEGARKAGMHGIVFKDAAQLKKDLRKLGIKI